MYRTEYIVARYHSRGWLKLVEQGWKNMFLDERGNATMIRQWRYGVIAN